MNSSVVFRMMAQGLKICTAHRVKATFFCVVAYVFAIAVIQTVPTVSSLLLALLLWLAMTITFVSTLAVFLYVLYTGMLSGMAVDADDGYVGIEKRVADIASGRKVVTVSGLLLKAFRGYVRSYRESFGGRIWPWFYIVMTLLLFVPVNEGNLLPWFQSFCEWGLTILVAGQVLLWLAVRDYALHPYPSELPENTSDPGHDQEA